MIAAGKRDAETGIEQAGAVFRALKVAGHPEHAVGGAS
jgi:hypothetical protein